MARRVRDAAELERMKLARQRFRSLIRSVVYNRIWLNDAEELQKFSMNVKRNVAMLVRRKHKIGVLTMAEKALIRTPHSLRSTEDRKQLLKLVTGMQCFSKLPPKVRARLCSVIKFLYLNAGRVILREGNAPDTIYYILYGGVEASRKVYDPLKGKIVDKVEFIYGPGDCIGDVELIEGCPRKHTYTATSIVEMMVVFGDDFDSILRAEMTKQWMEKERAIKALGYFDYLNEEQKTNIKKLSVIREFNALETIYSEDKGEASYTYFVLSGECTVHQSLQIKVREKFGKKTYELGDIIRTRKDDKLAWKNALTPQTYDIDQLLESEEGKDTELFRIKQALKAMDIEMISMQCNLRKQAKATLKVIEEEIENEFSAERMSAYSKEVLDEAFSKISKMGVEEHETHESVDFESIEEQSSKADLLFSRQKSMLEGEQLGSLRKSEIKLEAVTEDVEAIEETQKDQKPVEETKAEKVAEEEEKPRQASTAIEEFQSHVRGSQGEDNELLMRRISKLKRRSSASASSQKSVAQKSVTQSGSKASVDSRVSAAKKLKESASFTLENRFFDVSKLTFRSIFGLGEKFEGRVIMASTKVQCLLIPRFWLFDKEQNPGRIWQRRRYTVNNAIPSRQQIFKDFLKTKKWQKYKKDFISSILDPNSTANETHIEDIPIMFHIINPIED